jgi:hypothetical protein
MNGSPEEEMCGKASRERMQQIRWFRKVTLPHRPAQGELWHDSLFCVQEL